MTIRPKFLPRTLIGCISSNR